MQGLNRIFLLGRLGNDPQIYSTSQGRPYTGLSLATHRPGTPDESGNRGKEITDWHYIRVWGKQAESCAKYLTKGQPVLVEGYLTQYAKTGDNETSSFEGLEVKPEKKVTITALRVDFLPRAKMSEQMQ